MRSAAGEQFLRAVAETCKARLKEVPADAVFWRAQIGHEWIADPEVGRRIRGPHPEMRMKPLQDRAYEGRVNPKGIPCLYVATPKEVAMSEVRPWIGSVVSLARFQTSRKLTVVDCSVFYGQDMPPTISLTPADIEKAVWTHIDYAFSQPVTRSDNTAEYAATQILAEVFRAEGYDGVIYKSAFSADGYNLALFALDSAQQVESSIYEVKNAAFEFSEIS
ncbi:RES domain-containing protein [Rhodoligotrophos appendicifer]|uniref:RES family NAD+ phosphorylase n=1 Tax=Rhodoligotrophos appendicifer TaxID=987056 RepID=UPI001478ADC8|nr:RES family NAD+ phosphorylase [Rhodoligotrophos appendicifer]